MNTNSSIAKQLGGSTRRDMEKGTSVLEFALVLPTFLLLLCGLIQFGFLLHANLRLTQASSLATRYATLGRSDFDVQQKALELLLPTLPVPNSASPVVEITRGMAPSGDASVSVAISYNYPISVPFLDFVFPNGVAPLRSTSTMRSEL